MPEVINEKDCIQCGLCENYCPDICINVVRMG
jgi:NAD-dependent dihydropyrimidine dehydrogenase PreA subunit